VYLGYLGIEWLCSERRWRRFHAGPMPCPRNESLGLKRAKPVQTSKTFCGRAVARAACGAAITVCIGLGTVLSCPDLTVECKQGSACLERGEQITPDRLGHVQGWLGTLANDRPCATSNTVLYWYCQIGPPRTATLMTGKCRSPGPSSGTVQQLWVCGGVGGGCTSSSSRTRRGRRMGRDDTTATQDIIPVASGRVCSRGLKRPQQDGVRPASALQLTQATVVS
jgi:hypothetical protein